jgi:hypothetical protein
VSQHDRVGFENAELGCAVTDHAAQGRTVHTGLAVITGAEDRQHAYVALTRGTDVNTAYVFTQSPKTADPVPGPRPAPEIARYDRRTARPETAPAPAARQEALAVLAGVLDRDGQRRSATQTRNQALADADHLGLLHAIWAAETTPVWDQRYRDLVRAPCRPATAGNPATRPDGCGGPCAPPSWPAWTPPGSSPMRLHHRRRAGDQAIAHAPRAAVWCSVRGPGGYATMGNHRRWLEGRSGACGAPRCRRRGGVP